MTDQAAPPRRTDGLDPYARDLLLESINGIIPAARSAVVSDFARSRSLALLVQKGLLVDLDDGGRLTAEGEAARKALLQESSARTLAHLDRLDRIVAALKENPLAPRIRIFGSAGTKAVPGDIDAYYEGPSGLSKEVRTQALLDYLKLAFAGGNYGYLDPFALAKNGDLFVRHDGHAEWVLAQRSSARTIVNAGRSGIPVLEFSRSFVAEWEASNTFGAAPAP